MPRVTPGRSPHPVRGTTRRRVLACLALPAALAAAGCGPSPVDMVEHPVVTTPSRAAGHDLQRAAEPEESCAPAPAAPEAGTSGTRSVRPGTVAGGPAPRRVDVPADPARVLALGSGAVDAACLLGLQHTVVATGPLDGPAAWLPEPLVSLPRVDTADAGAVPAAARAHRPDLVLLPASADRDGLAARLADVAPTVVYDDDPRHWTDAVTTLTDALGRPRAGERALLGFYGQVDSVVGSTTPRDTEVSVVDLGDDQGHAPRVLDPRSLGVTVLEAVGARRPPAQTVRDGRAVPAPDSRPSSADEFSGDVVLGVLGDCPGCEAAARRTLESPRWTALPALRDSRFFVVDAGVWRDGDGLVAARAVLGDVEKTINAKAAEG